MIERVQEVDSKRDRKKGSSIYPLEGKKTATGGTLNTHGPYGVNSFLIWNEQQHTVTAVTPMEAVKKGSKQRNCIITRYTENGEIVRGQTALPRSALMRLYEEGDEGVLDGLLSEQVPAWQIAEVLALFSPDAARSSFDSKKTVKANNVTGAAREELLPVLSGMVGVLRKSAENPFGVNDIQVTPVVLGKEATYTLAMDIGSGLVEAGVALNLAKSNIAVVIEHNGEQIQIMYASGHRLFKNENDELVPVDESDVALQGVAEQIFRHLREALPVAFLNATSERVPFEIKSRYRRACSYLNINSTSLLATGAPRLHMVGIGENKTESYTYPNGVVTLQIQEQSAYLTLRETFPIEGEDSRTGNLEERLHTVVEHYAIQNGELRHWTGKIWAPVSSSLTCQRIHELFENMQQAKEEQIRQVNALFGITSPEGEDTWVRTSPYGQSSVEDKPAIEDVWTL